MTTYRLVPVEPSEEMKRALATKIKTYCPEAPSYDMAHDLYETMLASAPVPQNELLEAALNAVPTNWCDSLLSGDNVPPLPWGCPEIERLLNGVRERIATIIRNAEQAQGTQTP